MLYTSKLFGSHQTGPAGECTRHTGFAYLLLTGTSNGHTNSIMSESVVDKDTLLELIDTVRSCIGPYKTSASLHELSSTTSLKDSDPLTELKKLSQIIKAHSTKIGIICQPDKFWQNLRTVYNELKSFNDKIFLLLSLLPLFHKNENDQWAQFFIKTLDSFVVNLLNGVSTLCDELDRSLTDRDSGKDERLYTIGIIWAACDSLTDLAEKGNFQILADSIRANCSLVNDVIEDIASWLEDPHFGDDLLLDADDALEDVRELKDETAANDEKTLEQMKCFLKSWEKKLKMIKLLLSSFGKSLTSNVYNSTDARGSTLDKLHGLQHEVIEQVDELISDFLISDSSFDPKDFEDSIDALNKSLKKMVGMIKKLNNTDPKKSRWIQVWETKYFLEDTVEK